MSVPERWLVLAVRSPSDEERAGLLGEGLLALGGRALQEADGRLVTHVPEPADPEAFLAEAVGRLRALAGDATLEIESGWQPHEEWAETWKRGLAPRRITERLVVTPTWETPDARPGDVVIALDPGMAFGNAEHGTTRGCLRLLDEVVRPGERVLDVGAGSGILSIAAARLGAAEVLAIEGDPLAGDAVRENLATNGAQGRVTFREAWADPATLAELGTFDGLLANLESGILHPLLPGLAACVRPGGWAIVSGVLTHELDALLAACAAHGLHEEATDADGEWRSVRLRRR